MQKVYKEPNRYIEHFRNSTKLLVYPKIEYAERVTEQNSRSVTSVVSGLSSINSKWEKIGHEIKRMTLKDNSKLAEYKEFMKICKSFISAHSGLATFVICLLNKDWRNTCKIWNDKAKAEAHVENLEE